MRKFIFILFLAFSFQVARSQQESIPFLRYEELEKRIADENAELLIVNFWATTCAPCVKELPHFMEVNRKYEGDLNFKMLLVSLDRTKDIERVKKFIREKSLTAEVVLLDDNKRMNTWIPRFNSDWGGEIPATVFYKKGKKFFFITVR